MTYKSIEEIEAAYPEPENETKEEKTRRLRNINQAKKRLAARQQKASQVAGGSSTATSQIQTPSQPEVEEEDDPNTPSRKRTKTTHLETEQETEGFCCQKGQVILQQLNPTPQPLLDLLTSENASSFLRYIRLYKHLHPY